PGGTFTGTLYWFYWHEKRIAIADMDLDGKPDLVLTGYDSPTSGRLEVWRGAGNGTFAVSAALNTSGGLGTAVGDVTGDLYPAVVVARYLPPTVAVFQGSSTGTLTSLGPVTLGSQLGELALADVNGDGLLDLIGADLALDAIVVRLGTGGGAFGPEAEAASVS